MRKVLGALARPQTYVGHAREAVALAHCAVRYPLGVIETAVGTGRRSGDSCHDTPVLLVHGYGHNRSGWFVLDRELRHAGFTSVHTMNYLPYLSDVPDLARRLAERVETICRLTGSDRVHVVGHSLGGVVLRWYVQELGGEARVATAVTVASPHEGTVAAFAGFGRTARELRPESWVVRRLRAGARRTAVRWVAYYSNIDMLVQPPTAAKLRQSELDATNVLVKDQGHISMMMCPAVTRSIVEQLEVAEASDDGLATITPLHRSA